MREGFGITCSEQYVECHFLGEPGGALPPLVKCFQTTKYWVILLGRLYYRRELFLGIGAPETANDAELAVAVYRRWGQSGLTRLEGDYVLAIWDVERRSLIGARDPLGGYPLYWAEYKKFMASAIPSYS
jgi:asparagine synthase (glutamine-hydrolysing)